VLLGIANSGVLNRLKASPRSSSFIDSVKRKSLKIEKIDVVLSRPAQDAAPGVSIYVRKRPAWSELRVDEIVGTGLKGLYQHWRVCLSDGQPAKVAFDDKRRRIKKCGCDVFNRLQGAVVWRGIDHVELIAAEEITARLERLQMSMFCEWGSRSRNPRSKECFPVAFARSLARSGVHS
jgi:hypothetical protein